MRAGAAQEEITPPVGVELTGFAGREQPSTSIHDPLWLRGLYLEQDSLRLLWLHADLLGFGSDLVERLRGALGDATGLEPREIVLSATHTHSGPPTVRLLRCGSFTPETEGYLDRLTEAAVSVARKASSSPAQVSVIEGRSTCPLAIDRRHEGRQIPPGEVVALGFRREEGELLAVLANYGVHPVSLDWGSRAISPDLFGVAADVVSEGLLGRPVVMLTNGACGDLNPPSRGSDFGPCEEFGRQLGAVVLEAARSAREVPGGLESRLETVPVPVEPLDKDSARRRADELRRGASGDGVWDVALREAADLWQGEMERMGPVRSLPLEMQIVRIADRTFVCFGAEVFAQMDADLKRAFGGDVTVVSYANGDLGYLAPQPAHDEGGYEVDSAYVYYGTPPLKRGSFELALERATHALMRA